MSASPGLQRIYSPSLIQGMSLPSLQEEELSPTDCSEDSVEIKPRPISISKTLLLRPLAPMLTEAKYGSCPPGATSTSTIKRKLPPDELRRPACDEKRRRISGSEEDESPSSPSTPKPLNASADLFLPSPSPPNPSFLPPGYMVPHPHQFPFVSLLGLNSANTHPFSSAMNADYLSNYDHQQRALVSQYVLSRLNASAPWPPMAASRPPFPPLVPNMYQPHSIGYLHPPLGHPLSLYHSLPHLFASSAGATVIPSPAPIHSHIPHPYPLLDYRPVLSPSLNKYSLPDPVEKPAPSPATAEVCKDLRRQQTSPCSPPSSLVRANSVPPPSPPQQPLSLVKQNVSLSGIQCQVVQDDLTEKSSGISVQSSTPISTAVTSISKKSKREKKTNKSSAKPEQDLISEADGKQQVVESKNASKCELQHLPVKKRSAFLSVEALLGTDTSSSSTKPDPTVKKEPDTVPPRPPSVATVTPSEKLILHVQQVVPPPAPLLRAASPDGRSKHRNYKNMTRERRMEANARERTRVHTISAAFENLRRAVPSFSHGQRLSKLSILRVAASYILALSKLSADSEGEVSTDTDALPSLASCVDLCTRTLTTEGQLRRKRDDARPNDDSDDDL